MVTRSFRVSFFLVKLGTAKLLLTLFVATLHAQAPPAASQAAPAPQWHGLVTVGTSWGRGVTKQTSVDLQGEIFRSSADWSHYIRTSYSFSNVRFGDVTATVADAQNFRYIIERNLSPRVYVAFSPAFKRNKVQHVDYRFAESFGFGFRAVQETNVKFSVAPFVSLTQQKVNVERVDGFGVSGGFLQSFQWKISPVWSATEDLVFMQDVNTSDNRRVQGNLSVSGLIRKPLGLNISYLYDLENIVLAGSEKAEQRLSVGIQLTF